MGGIRRGALLQINSDRHDRPTRKRLIEDKTWSEGFRLWWTPPTCNYMIDIVLCGDVNEQEKTETWAIASTLGMHASSSHAMPLSLSRCLALLPSAPRRGLVQLDN